MPSAQGESRFVSMTGVDPAKSGPAETLRLPIAWVDFTPSANMSVISDPILLADINIDNNNQSIPGSTRRVQLHMLASMRSFVLVQHVKTRRRRPVSPDFRLVTLDRIRLTSAGEREARTVSIGLVIVIQCLCSWSSNM
jgi:hypothetical protein